MTNKSQFGPLRTHIISKFSTKADFGQHKTHSIVSYCQIMPYNGRFGCIVNARECTGIHRSARERTRKTRYFIQRPSWTLNKRTNKSLGQILIIKLGMDESKTLNLWCCSCWCSIFCAVGVTLDIVWIKIVPLDFLPRTKIKISM